MIRKAPLKRDTEKRCEESIGQREGKKIDTVDILGHVYYIQEFNISKQRMTHTTILPAIVIG